MSAATVDAATAELHAPDPERAASLLGRLLGWDAAPIELGSAGQAWLAGVVQVVEAQGLTGWVPHRQVVDVRAAAASVEPLLPPVEGPDGWIAVVAEGAPVLLRQGEGGASRSLRFVRAGARWALVVPSSVAELARAQGMALQAGWLVDASGLALAPTDDEP